MDSSPSQPSGASSRGARPEFTKEQEATVLLAACRRVTAAVRRERAESTRQLLGDAAKTPVYGAFVTLRREGQLRSCCGHLGPAVSLAEALDHAADRAATDDPRFPPITRSELNQLDVDVWVLWGPEPVAARGEARVDAVVIGKHGLLIERGYNRGLLLPGVAIDHGFDARTFLQQVCLKAGLPTDAWKRDDTTLMVFEGQAIPGRMADVCPPGGEDDARPAAVAGRFYPGSPREVQAMLDEMFAAVPKSPAPQPWAGALAPHAGWIYSGKLAAAVFSRIAIPDCAIILCPKHRPGGARWAVAPHRRWLFPGGELASDPELAERLADGVEGLELDADAHQEEHAIEVQLPILARLAPRLRVVGITVGDSALPELLRFGVAMSVVLRDMPQRPLLVVSSDMNHFADVATTQRLDSLALNAIATRDPECVYETVRQNRISMCGMAPCVVAMEALRWLGGLNRCESVGHATSADAGGPVDRVVGYAGLLFG
jgi:AmmeMemoRadiSam system protein B/AmmeMemoRadiSam system protein A